jgi:ADP-ribosylglycohydrolase
MGIMKADGDLGRGICIAVMGGWDTDCNGATAGSVLGVMLGAKKLPAKWTAPLNNTLQSAVFGFATNKISDLAARTLAVARKIGPT